jgi:hypothetical protein
LAGTTVPQTDPYKQHRGDELLGDESSKSSLLSVAPLLERSRETGAFCVDLLQSIGVRIQHWSDTFTYLPNFLMISNPRQPSTVAVTVTGPPDSELGLEQWIRHINADTKYRSNKNNVETKWTKYILMK